MSSKSLLGRLEVVAGVGRGLREFAAEQGVDIESIAKKVGIDMLAFERFDERLSLDRFSRLLGSLARAAKDDAFGLKFGLRFPLGGSGPYGYGLKSAPDLRRALEFAAKYSKMPSDINYTRLEFDSMTARFEWGYAPVLRRADQLLDFVACAFVRQCKISAGARWLPISAELQREAPRDPRWHYKHLAPKIAFESDANVFVIDAAHLDRRNPNADPVLFEMMGRQCADIVAERPKRLDFTERVEDEILSVLGHLAPTAANIAPRLRLSERSLQRRLAESGETFQTVVDRVRRELSDQLLRDDKMTISQVALELGFSATSAYSRSATRWYGATPSEIRSRLRR